MHSSATARRQPHKTLNQKYEAPLVIWQRLGETQTHRERLLDLRQRAARPGINNVAPAFLMPQVRFQLQLQSWTETSVKESVQKQYFFFFRHLKSLITIQKGHFILFFSVIFSPLFHCGSFESLNKIQSHLCTPSLHLFLSSFLTLFYNLLISQWCGFILRSEDFPSSPRDGIHTRTSALSKFGSIMACVTKSLLLEWWRTEAAFSHVFHLCSLGFPSAAALLSPLRSPHGSKAITPICAG